MVVFPSALTSSLRAKRGNLGLHGGLQHQIAIGRGGFLAMTAKSVGVRVLALGRTSSGSVVAVFRKRLAHRGDSFTRMTNGFR